MAGGAGKRAKRGEKEPATEAANLLLNPMFGDHEAMHLLPQRLPNVASSGQSAVAPPPAQVGEKRSYEPDYLKDDIYLVKAKHKASMASAKELSNNVTRVWAGDKTLCTQTFGNGRELSPFVEACRVTIQRVEPKNTFAKGHLKLHNEVLREELLLREDAIREDQTRREHHIQKQIDDLKIEKKFFEENICDLKQKAIIESNKASQVASKAAGEAKHPQCTQS